MSQPLALEVVEVSSQSTSDDVESEFAPRVAPQMLGNSMLGVFGVGTPCKEGNLTLPSWHVLRENNRVEPNPYEIAVRLGKEYELHNDVQIGDSRIQCMDSVMDSLLDIAAKTHDPSPPVCHLLGPEGYHVADCFFVGIAVPSKSKLQQLS